MASPSAGSVRPAERYGDDVRARHRRPLIVAVAVGAAVLVGLLTWFALAAGSPGVSGELASYRVRSAAAVDVRISVVKDASERAVCRLRARSADFATVGTAEVTVPRGGPHRRDVRVAIPTRARAVNGELISCVRG